MALMLQLLISLEQSACQAKSRFHELEDGHTNLVAFYDRWYVQASEMLQKGA